MLYMMPSKIPSSRTSLQLFSLLRAHDETDRISSDSSQSARLFARAGIWNDEDRLLFILMCHQPPHVVHINFDAEVSEERRAEAFSREKAFGLRLYKDGQSTVLHLTTSRYLEIGLFKASLSSSTPCPSSQFSGWRKLCSEAIQSGASLTWARSSDWHWDTPLGLAMHRVLDSLAWHGVGWERSKQVLDACLQTWLALLRDNNVQLSLYYVEEWKSFEKVLQRASGAAKSAHWSWWLSSVSSFCVVEQKFLYRVNIVTDGWQVEKRFQGQPTDSKGWQERVRELHNGDLAYLSIPGAWDTPECQAWWRSTDTINQRQPKTDVEEEDSTDLLALIHNCHGRGWLSTYQIPGTSREAGSFRKLRLGLEGFENPLNIDYGHGKSCRCRICHHKRQPVVERRALEATRVTRRLQESHYTLGGGGGGGGGGWGSSVSPFHPETGAGAG